MLAFRTTCIRCEVTKRYTYSGAITVHNTVMVSAEKSGLNNCQRTKSNKRIRLRTDILTGLSALPHEANLFAMSQEWNGGVHIHFHMRSLNVAYLTDLGAH
jgi:hypothetical protein